MTGHGPNEAIGAAIRRLSGEIRAPDSLAVWLEERRSARRGTRRRAAALRLAAAGAVAAALAVAVVLTSGAAPTVQDVAASALQPPERPAPPPAPGHPEYIDAEVGGVHFPDWERTWGWRAVGARTDTVDGRRALTVIYRKGDRGVHYTVVAGEPLDVPDGARRVVVEGTRVAVVRPGGGGRPAIITWRQDGQTCLLASTLLSADDMLRFVAW